MTTYQKLKKENKTLREQLIELVINPASFRSLQIRAAVLLNKQIEDVVWAGDYSSTTTNITSTCLDNSTQ